MFSIMTPTRSRPDILTRMVTSAKTTATSDLQIIVWLDDDDPFLDEIVSVCHDQGVLYRIGPRDIIHSARWDMCLPLATGEFLFHANDDIVFRTPGWDKMIEEEFSKYPDKILMVHGDDLGCQADKFGCHPCVHRRWVETLGYFIPPYFDGEWGDAWVNDLANRIGRRKFLPFVTEHMHRLFGKAKIDQTTIDYVAHQNRQNPSEIYKLLEPYRITEAEKLRLLLK